MTSFAGVLQLLPELLLLAGACCTLILGARAPEADRQGKAPGGGVAIVSPFTLIVLLAAFVISLLQKPEGVVETVPGLWLTSLTHYTRLITLGVGMLIVLVNWHQSEWKERGEYMALIQLSLLGIMLTAAANDLVVLFFAIELVSVPTYVLIALSRNDARASEASVKYFFLGALAAAILAYGMSFLYGMAGTTTLFTLENGVAVSKWTAGAEVGPLALVGLLLVIGGLAFKIAAVPFHVYAPDVYEGAASPVTGMLGFVPKFAGFIALIKILSTLNWELPGQLYWVLWLMAACTMTFGNVLALLQKSVKRMLAYSSIAHTGYMLIALLVGPAAGAGPMRDGVAALLFYMAVYGLMNLGAFALLTAYRRADNSLETLDDLGGLSKRAPMAALGLAICVFSLMGFPPTAGFLGKLYIFSSAFSIDATHPFHGPMVALAIIGVVNSAIAAAYYLRIVGAAYVREEISPVLRTAGSPVRIAIALCSLPMLLFFAWPGDLVREAGQATVVLQPTSGDTPSKLTRDDSAGTYESRSNRSASTNH
ncbi:MAG: NADH-quinone oxidoreductase subunit N [Planctomycetota bacterium]|jgi:NADH-quinone oxidoreductase subunit N